MILSMVLMFAAPPPKAKEKSLQSVEGVYVMEGISFEAVLWFQRDGRYGARWNGSHYEGTWKYQPGEQRIQIMERILGSPDAPHPWSVPAPGHAEPSGSKLKKVSSIAVEEIR
jgi:hypothetical protein